MMFFAGLVATVVVIWSYEKLYEDEPWYEHLLFWSFALGLAYIWTFG
jgi:hypothetical protein